MADESGNQELRGMTVDELQQKAKDAGVSGVSDLRKDDLIEALAKAGVGGDNSGDSEDAGAGPDG
ncbi:MAG TPA: Rho termination factor N-terminal domain-containing protein, partial [Glaciihabitans sp.]|nr:Rho termination factor N-terminal domain-containing protein [Glaciihabitans sp.]